MGSTLFRFFKIATLKTNATAADSKQPKCLTFLAAEAELMAKRDFRFKPL